MDRVTPKMLRFLASRASVDGRSRYASAASIDGVLRRAARAGLRRRTLTISQLSAGWHRPLPPDHFRSGNGPLEALVAAGELLASGEADVVVIEGRDALRSGYTRSDRLEAMRVYPTLESVVVGYDRLTTAYLKRRGIDEQSYHRLRDALFDNYARTFGSPPGRPLPSAAWYEPLTPLLRGVDCANPVVDFTGALVLAAADVAAQLDPSPAGVVELAAVACVSLETDGPEARDDIVRFDHLRRLFSVLEAQVEGAGIRSLMGDGAALVELYTCFPVIPLAFLLESGLCADAAAVEAFLATRAVTITGGLNLAKAPWNNPALRALIAMHQALEQGEGHYGIVHGNGGLGYKQGLALLGRRDQSPSQSKK